MNRCWVSLVIFSFGFLFSVLSAGSTLKILKGQNLVSQQDTLIEISRKKITAIVFLSAKCPCSASHINEIKEIATEFPDVQFVGIHSNSDEKRELSEPYFKNAGLPFAVIEDQGQKIADTLGAYKTPHAFVLDNEGQILYRGGVTDSHDCARSENKYLRTVLAALNKGAPSPLKETRALGCVIHREGDNKNVWE